MQARRRAWCVIHAACLKTELSRRMVPHSYTSRIPSTFKFSNNLNNTNAKHGFFFCQYMLDSLTVVIPMCLSNSYTIYVSVKTIY